MMKRRTRVFKLNDLAKFDAANMSPEARRHWAGADNLSADAALQPGIRRLIVSRNRFEATNNGYMGGILETLADDTIGTGPRLQLQNDDPEQDLDTDTLNDAKLRRRERRFRKYTKAIHLAGKLRLARLSKARDGEVFFQKVINPGVRNECKIDLILFETEQVSSGLCGENQSYYDNGIPKEVDGVIYDRYGNPEQYRFYRVHPGALNGATDSYLLPAAAVIHYAHIRRPGQHRGLPELTAGLTVFNDLRRYGNSVLAAAETAAVISFLLETDVIPDPDEVNLDGELDDEGKKIKQLNFTDIVPMAKNAGVALPEGWKGHQLKAEQPTSTYCAFSDAKLNEAARAISMPFNVAKGNSSTYNYASGRLDHQVYHRKIQIERQNIEEMILDDIYEQWEKYDQAFHREDYDDALEVNHVWMWDGFEHADPAKEANAQATRLTNGTTTLAEECAAQGRDYEQILRQRGREKRLMQKYGIDDPEQSGIKKGVIENEENE
ncbi:MAG: phage portal protein [Lentisphaerae bacterium]|nr:phage portal protein [Lentisphaerota bacterium]